MGGSAGWYSVTTFVQQPFPEPILPSFCQVGNSSKVVVRVVLSGISHELNPVAPQEDHHLASGHVGMVTTVNCSLARLRLISRGTPVCRAVPGRCSTKFIRKHE